MSQHMPPLWQGAPLSGVPIIYLQPCELSFLGIQLKVSLKWSPLVHPYQTPLSWHFHFSLSELSALLCWLRLCQGCPWSFKKNADLPECWPSCMALLSCWHNCGHCGQWPCCSTLRWMHWQMLESVHFLIWQLIFYLLLRPPGHPWHPECLGEEVSAVALRKERAEVHSHSLKGTLHSQSCHQSLQRDTCPMCSAQAGEKTKVL